MNSICKMEILLSYLSHVTWMQHQCYRLWLLWTNWHCVISHTFKCVFTDVVWSCQRLSEVFTRLPAVKITAAQQLTCENWCSTQEGAFILLTRDVVAVKASQLSLSTCFRLCFHAEEKLSSNVTHHGQWFQTCSESKEWSFEVMKVEMIIFPADSFASDTH